jgi:hypothetical protein
LLLLRCKRKVSEQLEKALKKPVAVPGVVRKESLVFHADEAMYL